jgi:hypothetical protein
MLQLSHLICNYNFIFIFLFLKVSLSNRLYRGGVKMVLNEEVVKIVIIEVKLHVNQRLFEQGYITEEMYTKAKEIILKG